MSTTLAARDQENLTYTHRATAATKPLNQDTRAVQPKTPGNFKTPFRSARHDENQPIGLTGKTGQGGNKLDKNALITPLGMTAVRNMANILNNSSAPRTRAPLGNKTTNAKAHAFQTPAPLTKKPNQRPSTTRRSQKSKIVIAPTEPVQDTHEIEEDDEPDYGYAPQPPIELPNNPLDIEFPDSFPQFSKENMCRGYGNVYSVSPKDENGKSIKHKLEEEEYRKFLDEQGQKLLEDYEEWKSPLPTEEELNAQVDAMIAAGPKTQIKESQVDTVKAKSAAAALHTVSSNVPSVAMKETQSSMQKRKRPAFSVLKAENSKQTGDSASTTAPLPVSKHTIGFPKARQARSIVPKGEQMKNEIKATSKPVKLEQSKIHPKDFLRLYGEPPAESEMWMRLREYELLEEQGLGDHPEDVMAKLFPDLNLNMPELVDADEEIFQLPMPVE